MAGRKRRSPCRDLVPSLVQNQRLTPRSHEMEFDLIIVGGGLAGAALAVALQSSGLRIAVIEKSPPQPVSQDWDQRIYAVSPANVRFLEEIGVWRHLDASRVTPVYAMSIHGDAGGRMGFSASDS